MAPRKFQFALREILDKIAWIDQVTASKAFADFEADRLLRYGVERSLEVISEASRRIPDDLKAIQNQIRLARYRRNRQCHAPRVPFDLAGDHLERRAEAPRTPAGGRSGHYGHGSSLRRVSLCRGT